MSEANRQRRLQNREARAHAAEEHLRRTKRRRIVLVGGGLALAVIVGVVLVAKAVNKNDNPSAGGSTTTTQSLSVAGKPCVKVSDALPAGAPNVPVQVGPPPTKLVKVDLKPGTGAVVQPGATVTVDYIGVACSTGKIFDSSYQRNQSYTTSLGDVVLGWQQGIPGMRVGGSRLLGIPSKLGYGATGSEPTIAPDESLWFVVKVDKAEPPATTTTASPATTTTAAAGATTTTAPATTTSHA